MYTEEGINFLKNSNYPGRGIIIGVNNKANKFFQIYWIMGRSENSRNRILKEENGIVKTEAFDKTKISDPSLIIYNAMRSIMNYHIVSNGDQTDTIYEFLKKGHSFESALETRTFEPDPPNFTPRISGIVDLSKKEYSYKLSIIKTIKNNQEFLVRFYFNYQKPMPSFGHCITTYFTNGTPLPSFNGEPLIVPIYDTIEENLNFYWETLNNENLISLAVKEILPDNSFKVLIKNKNN